MKLKQLLSPLIIKNSINQTLIAQRLGKSPQVVSMTLNRDLGEITVKTLKEYSKAVGVQINFTKLIVN